MTKEKKVHIHITKELLLGLVLLLLVAAMGLGLTAQNYSDKFLPRTTVNGIDCTAMDAEDAVEALVAAAGKEALILRDLNGDVLYTADMGQLLDKAGLRTQLLALQAQQKAAASPLSFLMPTGYAYEAELFTGVTAGTLTRWLDEALYAATPRVEPEDAYIEITTDSYRLVSEVVGNAVNTRKCASELTRFLPTYAIGEADSYTVDVREGRQLPNRTSDSAILRKQMAELDSYFQTEITIDFENGNAVTLGLPELFAMSEITMTVGDASVKPVTEQVTAYVTELAETLGSHGVDRKYLNVAPTRNTVYYKAGDWGWQMEVDKLVSDVLTALTQRTDAVITPEYYCTDYYETWYASGNTLIEISLDNQYLWFYLDGRLMTETPVVTGNVSTWDITRTGYFFVNWKTADTVLRGPTWNDHVDFWMPFDDQIGLHDSSWRDEYGGDIYLTDGSHGCVNTPWEPMSIIFNNTWLGVPVIVY